MAVSQQHLEQIHRDRRLRWLARLGYASRGVVYGIVGFFALTAARGGGGTTDTRGALRTLLGQPLGEVLLGVVALGLLGYALWRLVQALKDTDGHGTDGKGLVIRGGLLVSAVSYALLALFAADLILGMGGASGSGGGQQDWTAKLLAQPFGQWLVGLVGLAVIGAGIAQGVKGWQRRYRRYLDVPPAQCSWVDPVSRYGLVARGVVFVLIGGFFIVAAVQSQPSEAEGLAGALRALQAQPYGAFLLGAVALGLLAFAVYSFVQALYRRLG